MLTVDIKFTINFCRISTKFSVESDLMCKNCPQIMVFPRYLLFDLIVSKLFPLQKLALSLS